MIDQKKIIFIPGWPYKFHPRDGFPEGLNIWEENINPETRLEADYVVAYSLGSIFALLNWEKNKNTKLILINPPLPKRSLWQWLFRWLKFITKEKIPILNQFSFITNKPFYAFKKAFNFFRINPFVIIDQIPKDKLTIIRGENDHFFCDDSAVKILNIKGIKLIEINNLGHNWQNQILDYINKIIES